MEEESRIVNYAGALFFIQSAIRCLLMKSRLNKTIPPHTVGSSPGTVTGCALLLYAVMHLRTTPLITMVRINCTSLS